MAISVLSIVLRGLLHFLIDPFSVAQFSAPANANISPRYKTVPKEPLKPGVPLELSGARFCQVLIGLEYDVKASGDGRFERVLG